MGLTSRTLRAVRGRAWDPELAGLDALETGAERPVRHGLAALAAAAWPKLAALAIALAAWQLVVLSGWKPEYALPGPVAVFEDLGRQLADGKLLAALAITARRAAAGYGIALLIGAAIGIAVSRWGLLRAAVGSLITGLQTMPSIAWFPLAILLFGLNETAILFVVVLGAAPAIANGLISGIDHVPPLLLRAGRVLGARGIAAYRHVILPAALPSAVAGLKQGWAFAWRSLMAGELLVIVVGQTGIGARLQYARELSDAPGLMATMIVILILGIFVDIVLFGLAERSIRERRGLIEVRA
jgi:NitT/TauT family transport system permease protein